MRRWVLCAITGSGTHDDPYRPVIEDVTDARGRRAFSTGNVMPQSNSGTALVLADGKDWSLIDGHRGITELLEESREALSDTATLEKMRAALQEKSIAVTVDEGRPAREAVTKIARAINQRTGDVLRK